MKVALVIVGAQFVMWVAAMWLMQSHRVSAPEDVLKDAAFAFFFWWLVIPIVGCCLLNEWVTEVVKRRRARVSEEKTLRSGQDINLYSTSFKPPDHKFKPMHGTNSCWHCDYDMAQHEDV